MFQKAVSLSKKLADKGHPFFSSDRFLQLSQCPECTQCDVTELLLSSSYSDFCFDSQVTSLAERTTFESINEVSSGNNDLGFGTPLLEASRQVEQHTNYFVSNYSGGRGDYFTLEQLSRIESEYLRSIGAERIVPSIQNFCITFGGQGAYSAIAAYLCAHEDNPKVLFFDSTYCSNYKPFSRKGIALEFIETSSESMIPEPFQFFQAVKRSDARAVFLVDFQNPSGENLSPRFLEELCVLLKQQDKLLIFSEAFSNLHLYGDSIRSELLTAAARTGFDGLIRINTLSKDFGLAGLRAGWMIAPEAISAFAARHNDELAYNAPMANSPAILAGRYALHRGAGFSAIPELEELLTPIDFEDLTNKITQSQEFQRDVLRKRVRMVTHGLIPSLPEETLTGGSYLENENFGVIVPEGGFNLSVRLKCAERFDALDLFRKTYLETGLILHCSPFIFKRQDGLWIRVTLARSEQKLREIIDFLRNLAQADLSDLLPVDSLTLSCLQTKGVGEHRQTGS